jgi:MoaA/NifB/PqqE/SkfB family radical SAM enzyme
MCKENIMEFTNLDWFITRVCDQAKYCRFCYAPWNAFRPDAGLVEAFQICDRISELGVARVTLCGGEPTLYAHLADVIQRLDEKGVDVILYSSLTNGFDFDTVVTRINTFSIPIDAVTPSIVQTMRGMHQFGGVLHFISWLGTLKKRPRVKVGTVVTKQNIDELGKILRFVEATGVVDIWRVYQFSPYGIGKRNETLFLVSDEKFREAVARVKACASGNVNIAERSREDTKGYCRIMDSRGMFYRYEESYIPLGISIFNRIEDIAAHFDNEKNRVQKAWHNTLVR